ncbi:uncharacterized protein [Molothrus aeneus]|uniref:uncharacterized protein n=1 Tax=Molothrus aeneus TaxID=84833 RepID=UPI00345743B7
MRRARAAALAALAALLIVAMVRAQVQQEPFTETTEGTGINITCSHPQIQTRDWIQWYRQLPGQGPELLALTMKESKELPGSAGWLYVSADRSSSSLWLAEPRRGDAAVYYCALGATGRGAGAAAGHEPPRAGPGGASRGRCRSARRAPGPRLRSSFLCPEPAAPAPHGSARPPTRLTTARNLHSHSPHTQPGLSCGRSLRAPGLGADKAAALTGTQRLIPGVLSGQ